MHDWSERHPRMMMRRRLRLIPEYVVAWLGWCLIPLLPRRLVVGLAQSGGALAWRLARRERRVSMANLDLVYGDRLSAEGKETISRASFQSFALTTLDLFWFSRFTEARFKRFVHVDDQMRAVHREAPLIGVTGHLGNWEILSMLFGMVGSPMTAVAMPLKNPFVDRMLHRLRRRTGSVAVAREGAVRALLRALRSKGAIGLLLDQNTLPAEGGIFVPFFGLPVAVSNAAGLLATKTGAPLVVVMTLADADGHYRCVVKNGLLSPAGMTAEQVTVALTERLESLIRENPGAWLWSYKRWRYYRCGDVAGKFPYYATCIEDE